MGCAQAELYWLADLLYLERCTGYESTEPCKRLLRLINGPKAHSMEEFRAKLGI